MAAHEDGRHQPDTCKCCKESGIEAPGETNVEHGTEQEDPESGREAGGADGCDLYFRDALGSEHLRQWKDDESAG